MSPFILKQVILFRGNMPIVLIVNQILMTGLLDMLAIGLFLVR
jgi:hypothetical protein